MVLISIALNQNEPGFDLHRDLILFPFAFSYFPSSMEQKNNQSKKKIRCSWKKLYENSLNWDQ